MTVAEVTDVLTYKNPKVSQYTIFDPRVDDTLINYGEMNGNFAIGMLSGESFDWKMIDPKIGTFVQQIVTYDFSTSKFTVQEEIELV